MSQHADKMCLGELEFSHNETQVIETKSGKQIPRTRRIHKCSKCGQIMNVIICPSFEDYVLNGEIRVTYNEYQRIKKAYEKQPHSYRKL